MVKRYPPVKCNDGDCSCGSQLEMSNKLKLYIWTNFRGYTSGLAFVIATDEMDAKNQIESEIGYEVYDWGTLEVKPLSCRIARCVSGGGWSMEE